MRAIVKGFVVWTLGLIHEEEHPMRKSVVLIMATTLVVATAALPTPAGAAPVKAVLEACDRMAVSKPGSCGYTASDNGDISGCTVKGKGGSGVCFYCPADGSGQCSALSKTPQGKFVRVPGDVLKSMTGSASGGVKSPVPPGQGLGQQPAR